VRMFFNRRNKKEIFTGKNVVVVGTSSLAIFWAALMKDNGANVSILVAPNKLEKCKKRGMINFKDTNFQDRYFEFNFVSTIKGKVDYCFLASRPSEAKKDLLLLNNHSLKGVCCINFSSFYNYGELKKMRHVEELRGYFDGAITEDKGEIQLLTRSFKVLFYCGDDEAGELRKLLIQAGVDCTKVDKDKDNFEQKLFSFALMNLIILVYEQSVSSLLNLPNMREQIDLAIKEYCLLNKNIEESSVLPEIYAFPDEYKGEFRDANDINLLYSLFTGIDYFKTPILSQWLMKASKKC